MTKNYDDPTKEEMHIPPKNACPVCKNDNADTVIWDDPETDEGLDGPATCLNCGTRYHPNHPEIPPQKPS